MFSHQIHKLHHRAGVIGCKVPELLSSDSGGIGLCFINNDCSEASEAVPVLPWFKEN